METVILDWLFALGQGIFIASFFYFLYLVIRFNEIVSANLPGRPAQTVSANPEPFITRDRVSFQLRMQAWGDTL